MGVEPALEDDGGGGLINHVATGAAVGGVMAGGFEGSMRFGGGETLVP